MSRGDFLRQTILFTAGQFAKLHHLNKRTLHYYDEIDLFSPAFIGENGYRYYTYAQSAALENILALRQLNMSITEIKAYLHTPNAEKFLSLSTCKIKEITQTIHQLQALQKILQQKQDMLLLSMAVHDGQIDCIDCEKAYLLITPFPCDTKQLDTEGSVETLLAHLQAVWQISAYKAGCGSILAASKLQQGNFDAYDGFFSQLNPSLTQNHLPNSIQIRPAGSYLRGFCIGAWDKIPALYKRMLAYAKQNALTLTGYAYESGLNEVAVGCQAEYVTQILIHCIAK